MVNNSTTKRSVDLCVGLDVIIAGTMDAMAGITDAAAVVDVVITTDAAAGIPSAKASARDSGRDTKMHWMKSVMRQLNGLQRQTGEQRIGELPQVKTFCSVAMI